MSDFRIPPIERTSPLWRSIEQHLNERIASLRVQNDADKTPEETAKLRGRIAECKAVLALADDRLKTSTT